MLWISKIHPSDFGTCLAWNFSLLSASWWSFPMQKIKLDVTRSMDAHVADFHRTCMIRKWLQAFHYSTPHSSHKVTNFLSLPRSCLNLIVKIAPQNRYRCSIRKLNIEFEALGNVNPTLGTQRRTILLQMLACGRGGEKLCIAAGRQKMALKIGINWDTTGLSQLSCWVANVMAFHHRGFTVYATGWKFLGKHASRSSRMFIKLRFKKQKTFEAVQETCELQCSHGQGGFQSSQDTAYPTTRQSCKSPVSINLSNWFPPKKTWQYCHIESYCRDIAVFFLSHLFLNAQVCRYIYIYWYTYISADAALIISLASPASPSTSPATRWPSPGSGGRSYHDIKWYTYAYYTVCILYTYMMY